MLKRRAARAIRRVGTPLALLLLLVGSPPVAAAPPKVTSLFPSGVARGQSATITASGNFDPWPVSVWVDRPGLDVQPGEKGKFTVTAAPDVAPGLYWLRFYNDEGASSLRPFIVGTVAEQIEQEPNDSHRKPQTLDSTNLVVNGQLARAGDVDTYALSLEKGQTLVASMVANRGLGAPMDASLQILSPDGFVIEQNDDYHDLDPQIVFTAPASGSYLVRTFSFPSTPTSTIGFAGGGEFVYRLTLTTNGFAEYPYPLALPPESSADVSLFGWNIPDEARTIRVAAHPAGDSVSLAHAALANSVSVRIESHAATVEAEADGDPPQPVTLPITVTGRIDRPRDSDSFEFTATKGQRINVRIESRSLGFPLDPVLRVTDQSAKVLAENDDAGGGRDAELSFEAPADGPYRVVVRDLHRAGGFRYVYRLTIAPAQSDFALTVQSDMLAITPGKPLEIPIAIDRRNGFAGEIEITATGLADGISVTPVRSASTGDSAKSVKLVFNAAAGTPSSNLRIVGSAEGVTSRLATAPVADLPDRTSNLWLTVKKTN